MQKNSRPPGLIEQFVRHQVAANLLMFILMVAGVVGIWTLNIQFLPTFRVNVIQIETLWPGASAEDVKTAITGPIEQAVRRTDNIKNIRSTSQFGLSMIRIEFHPNTNMSKALEDIREKVSRINGRPKNSEAPKVYYHEITEQISRLVITGPSNLAELRPLIHRFEHELLDRGIAKITIIGLPKDEISIQVPVASLTSLNMSLNDVAQQVAARSENTPAGTIGKSEVARQIRGLNQALTVREFSAIPLRTGVQDRRVTLGDVAKITRQPREDQVLVEYQGKPAVELLLQRSASSNSLTAARIIQAWFEETKAEVGQSLELHLYDESWQYLIERINMLLKNGLSGLLLIVIILMLFLNIRLAFWVAVGIPISFLATLAILQLAGGSINMISLFAFIMSLGIIVDDTIVVGEQAESNHQQGLPVQQAVEQACHKMFAPILASSLTTICAFLPLMMLTGIIGVVLFSIPLVVICVILASLVECFLILPGHLRQSLPKRSVRSANTLKIWTQKKFDYFRDTLFRRFIHQVLVHRGLTLFITLFCFGFSLYLVASGRLLFNFFPTPDGRILMADVRFHVGTPLQQKKSFIHHLQKSLTETNQALSTTGQDIVTTAVTYFNYSPINNFEARQGEQYASMQVELTTPDSRSVQNVDFMKSWLSRTKIPASVDSFTIYTPRTGPPGEDIDINISGNRASALKAAAATLITTLANIPGVSDVKDDLPYGQDHILYNVNALGHSLGLTTVDIGQQLHSAFSGRLIQTYHLPYDEIEVRVRLPDIERDQFSTLQQYPILTPSGESIPLGSIVNFSTHKSLDIIRHTDTRLSVNVTAKVDSHVNNINKIMDQLQAQLIPHIKNTHHVKIKFSGKAEEQAETFRDMKVGLLLGTLLIYIILAWVFGSYSWPIIVMLVVPLGLTGAIWGHWLMGIDLTLLSLFGMFGLSGIVVNDSIILITEYQSLHQTCSVHTAIVNACCNRIRAVFLTSVTTIAGLLPLLFETSRQAQFLIPMAISLIFGLAYATLLILVVIPTGLSLYEGYRSS